MHLYLLPFTNALTHPIERSKTKVSEETSNMVLILCANNDRTPARTKSITVTVVGRGTVLSHDDNECSRVRESSCTVDGALDLLHKAGAYSWLWPLQVLQLPIVHTVIGVVHFLFLCTFSNVYRHNALLMCCVPLKLTSDADIRLLVPKRANTDSFFESLTVHVPAEPIAISTCK